MARGMPPRGAGGGGRGAQPPRRGGQPAKPGQRPQKPAQRPGQQKGQPQKQAQKQAQTRQVLEQQRRAAQQKQQQQQQQRLRQQQFHREAHGKRRGSDAQQRTEDIEALVRELESILATGVRRSAAIDLEALPQEVPESSFDPGPLGEPAPEPTWEQYAPSPSPLPGWLAGRIQQQREESARARLEQARQAWQTAEEQREQRLAQARGEHDERLARRRAQAEAYNSRIARIIAGLRDREPAAVESFLRTVLRRMPLPAGFPRRYEVTHDPAGEHVTVRLVLPGREVVPTVLRYEYQQAGDQLKEVPRPVAECAALYHRVIAQVALLATRDILQSEQTVERVTLVGLVDRLDPATDQPVFAQLLRHTVERPRFDALDLLGSPPEEVLRELPAQVSPDPYAYEEVAEPTTAAG